MKEIDSHHVPKGYDKKMSCLRITWLATRVQGEQFWQRLTCKGYLAKVDAQRLSC